MVSKKKFFSACKCYENNKYGVDYVKPQLCIDEESHLIFCDRCGAIVDPFAAMLMAAIFEERQNREWGRYMESARRFWKIARSYKPYRAAIKGMDMPANCGECPLTYPVGFYRNLPFSVDYWDSKYCCRRCQRLHGEVEPDCENCDPMDI